MIVQYGSTIIAAGGVSGASGVSVNGRQVVDEAAFFRATSSTVFGRGNKQITFRFRAAWNFNTRTAAEIFALTHFATLDTRADLLVTCGEGEGSSANYKITNAVLESATTSGPINLTVWVDYNFIGGAFAQA